MRETNTGGVHSKEGLADWVSNHIHKGDVKKHMRHEESFNKRENADDLKKRMSSDLFK
ncbi:hypothetical protein EalM132_00058 [Exiguobacterium phage vB_EalM-132]|nr:hypothetical protein EalM132_00058 [Exiguobacterium phage vB_EalM-132]